MASATLPYRKAVSYAPLKGEFIPPTYVLREMPLDLPKDEVDREIAVLLSEHPKLRPGFAGVNLAVLPREAKFQLLADIKAALGIRPVRKRALGYVGPGR